MAKSSSKALALQLQRRDFLALSGAGFIAAAGGISIKNAAAASIILYSPDHAKIAQTIVGNFAIAGLDTPLIKELSPDLLFDNKKFMGFLKSHKGARIIALTDDCAAILLNDAIMGLRGNIHFHGEYSTNNNIINSRTWYHNGLAKLSAAFAGITENLNPSHLSQIISHKLTSLSARQILPFSADNNISDAKTGRIIAMIAELKLA